MKIQFTGIIDWPEPVDDRGTIDHEIGDRIVAAFLEEEAVRYDYKTDKFFYKGEEIEPFDAGTFGWKALNFSWKVMDED